MKKAWRSLAWLGAILVALIAANGASVLWNEGSWTPELDLDLAGGTRLVLAAQVGEGQSVSTEQLNQAVSIIRQRVDAAGVAEAQVYTQGDRNVVVAIPGEPDEQTLQRVQASAQLEFRPVLAASAPTPTSAGDQESPEPTPSETPDPDSPEATEAPATPTATPTDASDLAWVTPALEEQYDNFDCSTLDDADTNLAPQDEPLVTCEFRDGFTIKYLLGPVELTGEVIENATSGQQVNQQGAPTGGWAVYLDFNDEGATKFRKVTERLAKIPQTDPRNQFAIVLDGRVITAPQTNVVIPNGKAEISGSFTQESAKSLADQLKFGALPIGFELQSSEAISATLGTSQLASGLLAGLIGLILVVIYSLFQYRALGSVTVFSLVTAAVVTYLVITYLSNSQGYRLSLAGVAGLIVAIGITADSFIVYFERVRDELRDGRTLGSAVEAAWKRAFRTILASDTVSFLAAIVLYVLAAANVRGFAFTLGVTTVVDILVVALFTHPMLQLFARTPFFSSGHRLSGLDPKALGAVYRGRARFRTPPVATGRAARSAREAERRQTIAERKAAELSAGGSGKKES